MTNPLSAYASPITANGASAQAIEDLRRRMAKLERGGGVSGGGSGGAGSVVDATTTQKGKLKLANAFAGSADAPDLNSSYAGQLARLGLGAAADANFKLNLSGGTGGYKTLLSTHASSTQPVGSVQVGHWFQANFSSFSTTSSTTEAGTMGTFFNTGFNNVTMNQGWDQIRGAFSNVLVGNATSTKGTPIGLGSQVTVQRVQTPGGAEYNEGAYFYSSIVDQTDLLQTGVGGAQARVSLWGADTAVHSNAKEAARSLLNGIFVVNQHWGTASPTQYPSAGIAVVTRRGTGGGNRGTLNTYPVDIGIGIHGTSTGGTVGLGDGTSDSGIGFKIGLQIGGYGGGWLPSTVPSKIDTGAYVFDFETYGLRVGSKHSSAAGGGTALYINSDATDAAFFKQVASNTETKVVLDNAAGGSGALSSIYFRQGGGFANTLPELRIRHLPDGTLQFYDRLHDRYPVIFGTDNNQIKVAVQSTITNQSVTVNTTPNTFTTAAAHGYVAGDGIRFRAATFPTYTGGTITLGTTYYVIASGLTTTDFKVSATSGGSELDLLTAGTTVTVERLSRSLATFTQNTTNQPAQIALDHSAGGAGAYASVLFRRAGVDRWYIRMPNTPSSLDFYESVAQVTPLSLGKQDGTNDAVTLSGGTGGMRTLSSSHASTTQPSGIAQVGNYLIATFSSFSTTNSTTEAGPAGTFTNTFFNNVTMNAAWDQIRGTFSNLTVGHTTAVRGSPIGLSSNVTIEQLLTPSGTEYNEGAYLYASIVDQTDLLQTSVGGAQARASLWGADTAVHSNTKEAGRTLLNGVFVVNQHWGTASPTLCPSSAISAVTRRSAGGGNRTGINTYPIDIGIGVHGTSSGGLTPGTTDGTSDSGIGFKVGIQVGSYGGGWLDSTIPSKIGTGISVLDWGTYALNIGAVYSGATGTASILLNADTTTRANGLQWGTANQINFYRSANDVLHIIGTAATGGVNFNIDTAGTSSARGASSVAGSRCGFNGLIDLTRSATNNDFLRMQKTADTTSRLLLKMSTTASRIEFGDGSTANQCAIRSDWVLPTEMIIEASILYASNTVSLVAANGTGMIQMVEQSSDPAAPATNAGRIFFKDNGSGKTQMCVRFPTGAVQVIATEP